MMGVLESALIIGGNKCASLPTTAEMEPRLKNTLLEAYKFNDINLIWLVNSQMTAYYFVTGNFTVSAIHAQIANDLMESYADNEIYFGPRGHYDLAHTFYQSGEYEVSLRYLRRALNPHLIPKSHTGDTLYPEYTMNAWNTVGLCHEKLNQFDSALYAFNQALPYSKVIGSVFWKGLIEGNMGSVFYKLGQYDTAKVLLTHDVKESTAAGEFGNAANSMQMLAQIEMKSGQHKKALRMLHEAMHLYHQQPNLNYKANILNTLALAYMQNNKMDSAQWALRQYQHLHDSLENAKLDGKEAIIKMKMQSQANIHKLLTLDKEKKRVELIRNFSIIIIVLASSLGYLFLNRQRLKYKLKQKEALQQKLLAETEAANAKDQLLVFTTHLREKTKLVEELQEQLMTKDLNADQIHRIRELTKHSILTDDDWNDFKELFERVYPGFFMHLKTQVIDITLAEQRMAALIKLQLSSKEAAALLGISPNSVHKTRQRLRQRLSLQQDSELESYFIKGELNRE